MVRLANFLMQEGHEGVIMRATARKSEPEGGTILYLYVALGVAGFVAGFLFDWVSLRGPQTAKPVLWIAHTGLIIVSTTMLAFDPDRITLPLWANIAGAILLVVSCVLMVYVLFINLPLRTTYIANGRKRQVVKTGAYALVRHPGVLCWVGVLVGATAMLGSKPLLFTIPLWIALDIVWVAAQEKFIFTRLLDGYREYQCETPMLSPNTRSISAFVSGRGEAREGEIDARGT